ncbi:MAG: cytochrome c biogenesis protein CcdA [bacterium]|nr:cytochrome c biogenesis protein CcdA [bacterium]
MLGTLFAWLSNALYANPYIAVTASFIWGVLSILLSPCHLTSIPLIIGFIDEQGRISTKRAFLLSIIFSSGILITIALIGIITGMLGRILGDVGAWGNYIVAIIFFLVGLHLLDIITLPFFGEAGQPTYQKKGLWAAFILGSIFGIALGPCTFAYMAPMLGVAFTVGASNLFLAIILIIAYALGHILIIVLAGTFSEIVQSYLNWTERSKGTIITKKLCGLLVLIGGIYLIYMARS